MLEYLEFLSEKKIPSTRRNHLILNTFDNSHYFFFKSDCGDNEFVLHVVSD